jgi:hypothetical protein
MEPATLDLNVSPAYELRRTRDGLKPELEARKNPAHDNFKGFTLAHQGEPLDEAEVDLWIHGEIQDGKDPARKDYLKREYEAHRKRRGEKPFQYLEIAQERRRAAEFRGKVPVLETIFSGPQGFKAALPQEKYLDVMWKIRNSVDPELEKRKIANRMLHAAATGVESDDELWPVQREQYARQVLGWTGARAIDEDNFHRLAGKMLNRQRGDMERAESVYKQARMMAMRAQPMEDAAKETRLTIGERAEEFQPTVRAAYAEVYSVWSDDEIYAGRALFEKLAEIENVDVGGHVIGDFESEAWQIGLRIYGRSDQDARDRIMGLIASQAGVEGKQLELYMERLAKAFESGLKGLGSGVNAYGWRGEAERVRGWSEAENDPRRKQWMKDYADFAKGNADFPIDLKTAGVRVVEFLDKNRKGFWDSLDDYTLMAAESSPALVVASLPWGAGLPLLAADHHAMYLSELRRSQRGVSEQELSRIALGPALLSAGTDRLQALLLGRLPNTSAVLSKVLPKPLAVAGALGVNTGVQGFQETGQSLLLPAAEEIASALDKDVKGPDWREVLRREKEALGDYFGVSLVISLVAAGGGAISRRTDSAELAKTLQDRHGLELAGFDPAVVDTVVTMAGKDPQRAAELLHASWQEASVEDRKANALRKREEMERALMEGDAPAAGAPDRAGQSGEPAGKTPEQGETEPVAKPEETSGDAPDATDTDVPNRTLFGAVNAADAEDGKTESKGDTDPQPQIRRLTSLSTGQELHVFEAPDGTRSEHKTADEAQDALDTWEAEQEYEDWIGERLSKTRKKAKDMGGAGDLAIGDKIVERLMRKSFVVRGKGPVRKALFGARLAMTPEEIHTLKSPVEILLRYTPDGIFYNARRGSRVDHDSPANVREGEIFCHNHPGGRGPSDGDLKFALENPTCTMRIVTRNGSGKGAVYQIRGKGNLDAKVIRRITEFYRRNCEASGDDAAARDVALELLMESFGDFISVGRMSL